MKYIKAIPCNPDGAAAQSDFSSDDAKIRRIVDLPPRIFVKYDGKGAGRCAGCELRGNALTCHTQRCKGHTARKRKEAYDG